MTSLLDVPFAHTRSVWLVVPAQVLGGISERVRKEKENVDAARRRVEAAGDRIGRLAGSSKATRVFSSAKFPPCQGRGVHSSVMGDHALAGSERCLLSHPASAPCPLPPPPLVHSFSLMRWETL